MENIKQAETPKREYPKRITPLWDSVPDEVKKWLNENQVKYAHKYDVVLRNFDEMVVRNMLEPYIMQERNAKFRYHAIKLGEEKLFPPHMWNEFIVKMSGIKVPKGSFVPDENKKEIAENKELSLMESYMTMCKTESARKKAKYGDKAF